jgi:hypothetical protein
MGSGLQDGVRCRGFKVRSPWKIEGSKAFTFGSARIPDSAVSVVVRRQCTRDCGTLTGLLEQTKLLHAPIDMEI